MLAVRVDFLPPSPPAHHIILQGAAALHSSHFRLFRERGEFDWGRKPTPRPQLTIHPYSKNAPIQMTPVSLVGKMIPDVPGPRCPRLLFPAGNCFWRGMASWKATHWLLT